MKKWETLKKETLIESPLFKFMAVDLKHGEKHTNHKFYILETSNWVNIVPITPDGKILLIKQYRAGTDEITIEVPGGIIDKGETDPITAAKRELEEETGYIGENYELLGFSHPNPSFITNTCYFVLAKNVRPLGTIHFDPSEYIESFTVSFSELKKLLLENKITHALTLNAFFFLQMAGYKIF